MQDNIIQMMVDQHKILISEIANVDDYLKKDSVSFKEIVENLVKFKIDLLNHLKLEEDFYNGLLKSMEKKGVSTNETKEFISEMIVIEKKVVEFLEKFNTVSKISENLLDFKSEFTKIKKSLIIRIESEEDGIYLYGNIFLSSK